MAAHSVSERKSVVLQNRVDEQLLSPYIRSTIDEREIRQQAKKNCIMEHTYEKKKKSHVECTFTLEEIWGLCLS